MTSYQSYDHYRCIVTLIWLSYQLKSHTERNVCTSVVCVLYLRECTCVCVGVKVVCCSCFLQDLVEHYVFVLHIYYSYLNELQQKVIHIILSVFFIFLLLKAVSMTGGESMHREPLRLRFDNQTVNITAVAGETVILPCVVEHKEKAYTVCTLYWLCFDHYIQWGHIFNCFNQSANEIYALFGSIMRCEKGIFQHFTFTQTSTLTLTLLKIRSKKNCFDKGINGIKLTDHLQSTPTSSFEWILHFSSDVCSVYTQQDR